MKNTTLLELNPKDISERDGFNTRYDLGDLRELKISMEQKGFDPSEPLIVTKDLATGGKYLLGSQGHRRLTVAKDLGLKVVFAILEPEDLSDEDRNLDIIRLNSGEPLPMLAQARVVERAFKDNPGMTQLALSKLLGKTAPFINDCTRLVKTTKKTQKWIEQEKISATEVVALIRELDAKTEEGYDKVESAIEKLLESATKQGKKKVTKKTKDAAEDDESDGDEEREAREKEAREAVKARYKELQGYEKRVTKLSDAVMAIVERSVALPKDDQLTPFQLALLDYQVALASFLMDKATDSGRKFADRGDGASLGDIGAAQRALEKAHKETIKETTVELKETAKEQVDAIKDQLKETKEETAKRIKAAKAAVAQV